MTPIELAIKYGVHNQNLYGTCDRYVFNDKQLDAYNRALVAPYVMALWIANDALNSCGFLGGEKSYNTEKVEQAKEALAAHREMFGGE